MGEIDEGEPPWLEGVAGEQVRPLIAREAPVIRVQAGPGTGKTFGLRKRVLRLLHPRGLGADPARVLVCSFNRVIASDLRNEIAAELAPHGLGSPKVTTVHSLCAALVGGTTRLLLPHEEEAMVYDLREEYPQINEQYDRKQTVALRALREHDSGSDDHPALAQAVRGWLVDHAAGLIGDVTRTASNALRQGDLDGTDFDHVIVDEFQDLTQSEADVLVRLRSPGGSFVALGDAKQSIYAFRGNNAQGLDALPDLVQEEVADSPMNECQRCPPEIVALANAVMALEGDPLVAARPAGGQIHIVHASTPSSECSGLASEIARVWRLKPDERHLVLVTRRQWGYDLRDAIRAVDPGAPVETSFSEDVLETWAAREAFIFFELLADPDPVAARDWVAYRNPTASQSFKAPSRNAGAYLKLKERVGVLTVPLIVELAGALSSDFAGSGKKNLHGRLHRFRTLEALVPNDPTVTELIDYVFDSARWVAEDDPRSELATDDIGRLNREAKKIALSLEEPTATLVLSALRYQIATREPLGREDDTPEGIRIVTLWGAKGLTADYVYVMGLADEALPGESDPDSTGLTESAHLDEQRRLLYVSLTRAKKALVLSRPKKVKKGSVAGLGLRPTASWGWWQNLTSCRFLKDLPTDSLPVSVDVEAWEGLQLVDGAE